MKITFDAGEFLREWVRCSIDAFPVRVRPAVEVDGGVRYGKVLRPHVMVAHVQKTGSDLYDAIRAKCPRLRDEVIVVGQGKAHSPSEKFVWRGSSAEFEQTWEGY